MNIHTMSRPSRGILAVRAEDRRGMATILNEINADLNAFKDRYGGRIDGLQASVDNMAVKLSGLEMGAGRSPAGTPADPEYTRTFAGWARNGNDERQLRELNAQGMRANIQASMQTGSDTAGGYLAPIEWDRNVLTALQAVSPMRRLATVITTTTRGFSTVWNARGWGSGWVGETAARPETTAATLASVPFTAGEIYANPAITQQLLDDADFPMEQWLADELANAFTVQESLAFIAGDGTNKPIGLLTYATGGTHAATHPAGAIPVSTVASATLIASDELIDLVYAVPAPYRQGAAWLMNSATAGFIMKIKDGDGNYVWQRSLVAGQPSTLFGYPVEIDENMPDIAAAALPIVFGNFQRGYVINDRMGVRILRDPYTNKPYVNFYSTKRVGGGVRDPNAFRVLKMAAA